MKLFIVSLWLATVFTVLVVVSPDSDAAMIGHWTFDEGSGTTAYDSSGNGLNGTIANATYTAGRIGSNALYFSGTDAYVTVLNNSLLVPETIGISLWFKTNSAGYDLVDVIDKGHGSGSSPYFAGYALQWNQTSVGGLYGNGTGFYEVGTNMPWADNNWHHLVVNLGEDGCQLYIDGVLEDSAPADGPLVQNDSDLYFGKHRTLGRFFQGAIDDIRLYDGALSQSHINPLFIPEPATIALLGFGGLSLIRRKK